MLPWLMTITVDNGLGLMGSGRGKGAIYLKGNQGSLFHCVHDLEMPGEDTELEGLKGRFMTQGIGNGHMVEGT